MECLWHWLRTCWPMEGRQPGVDLGEGRVLPAEEVLESHFRRLSATRDARAQNVTVQVGENLTMAITVLAPHLFPLTVLAEDVAQALPQVHPAPHFRQTLHRALERTHRQHAAQRLLGTRPAPAQNISPWRQWGSFALLGLCTFLLLAVSYRWQYGHRQ